MRERIRIGWLSLPTSVGSEGLGVRDLAPLFLAVALSFAVVDTAMAQSAPPPDVRVSFTADRSELTVGEAATLSLVVSHSRDLAVVVPRVEREWGPFEVQAQTSVQTVSVEDGVRTIAKQFRVALFAPGTFETPSLPISVRSPDGSVEQFHPSPVRFTVNSVLSGSDEQLRRLRPPADLSTPLWEQPAALVPAVLALLTALVAGGYYLHRRSHRQAGAAGPVFDARSPWEAAIQDLDHIGRLDLPGSDGLKEHYTLVAATLRSYLGATYLRDADQMAASDMSTEEIGAAIGQSSLDQESVHLVIELFHEADLVKFADYSPAVSRAYEAADQVRNLVEKTRLSFEEAATVGAAPRRRVAT